MYARHIQGIYQTHDTVTVRHMTHSVMYQVYIKICMKCQLTLLHVIKHFLKQSVYSIEVQSNTLIHLANPSLLLQ